MLKSTHGQPAPTRLGEDTSQHPTDAMGAAHEPSCGLVRGLPAPSLALATAPVAIG